jgi:Asp-tRNA(Asn)/Glu-tRNA(Gln) amidotransferase A subunit family amidase
MDQAEDLLRSGDDGNPLWGVPVGVKDIIDVEGAPTACGSPAPTGPAHADADVVASLRRAGMIVLGKTQTSEFAWFGSTDTGNPRAAGRSPGGSSSGSAAAVAARTCPVALGTQTAGSIMRPAAFCGVAAVKPTHGLLSVGGVTPVAPSLDTVGVMGNRVEDVAVVLRAMTYAGHVANGRPEPIGRARIGVVRDYFWDHGDPDVLEAADEAIARLRDAGADVVDVSPGSDLAAAHLYHETIMLTEMAYHRRDLLERHPEWLSARLRDDIARGLAIGPGAYARARVAQLRIRAELDEIAQQFDALVTPGSKTLASPFDDTGDPAFHQPFSLAGVPTVLVPSGYTAEGLPVSIQLVGPWCGDQQVLSTAEWCARVLDFDSSPLLVTRG